jgi:hypothetical protein
MSEQADHLWSYLSRPENRGMSLIKPCCSLPQSAHDGVTWAELLAMQAWAHDDIPLLETASRHAAALKAAPDGHAEVAALRMKVEGQDLLLRAYRLGTRPPERAFALLKRADATLAE